jgi:hypothetical protein
MTTRSSLLSARWRRLRKCRPIDTGLWIPVAQLRITVHAEPRCRTATRAPRRTHHHRATLHILVRNRTLAVPALPLRVGEIREFFESRSGAPFAASEAQEASDESRSDGANTVDHFSERHRARVDVPRPRLRRERMCLTPAPRQAADERATERWLELRRPRLDARERSRRRARPVATIQRQDVRFQPPPHQVRAEARRAGGRRGARARPRSLVHGPADRPRWRQFDDSVLPPNSAVRNAYLQHRAHMIHEQEEHP